MPEHDPEKELTENEMEDAQGGRRTIRPKETLADPVQKAPGRADPAPEKPGDGGTIEV